MRTVFLISVVILGAGPAEAGQTLIPTPFPEAVGGNAQPLEPVPQRIGGPQRLRRDPYPQATGETAQGNPPIAHARHHRQRLVPNAYRRKYRVDRR